MSTHPPNRVLTLRELNRAMLARQMLLDRAALPAPDAIARLAGLQAQWPKGPYLSLWTRLRDFQRDDLSRAAVERRVVKATLMRATLHLFTTEDYLRLRPAIQPALTHSMQSILRRRLDGLDVERLVTAARAYFDAEPRTFAALRDFLAELEPGRDASAMSYVVRTHLPLIQVANQSAWSYPGNPSFTTANAWLGRSPGATVDLRSLVFRYLAAFGPATVQDVQSWSGLPRLKEPLEAMKAELRTFRDERGRELLDVPDGLLPAADQAAPPRFLPEWDNALIGHADRTRLIADPYRALVYLGAPRMLATIWVDGFVRGAWRIERAGRAATLVIRPFEPLPPDARAALANEGERLVRFVEYAAETFDVRFENR
jgi:hypothetical protein